MFVFMTKYCLLSKRERSYDAFYRNLLKQTASSAWIPKCFECPSTLRVPKCLEYPSAQALFECLSAIWVPNFPLSALRVKKVGNITRNGLVNSFIEFLKTFQSMWCVARFGTICTILKTWKTRMEECQF